MNTKRIVPLALASALFLPGLSGADPAQDYDNLDACCLAAEYRLPESRPQPGTETGPAHRTAAAKVLCQVPLGDVACCVGTEWKLDPH
jgi:hypothetical protein